MIVVVIPFDGGLLDRAVHALDLTIGPRVVRFGQAMLDPVCLADQIEAHFSESDAVAVARLLSELDAIVRQDRVDAVRNGLKEVFKELPRSLAIGIFDELSDSVFAGPVNAYEEIELALDSLDLGDIYVEEADRVALELLTFWLVTIHVWQTRYAMPLKASMQRRPRQVRDRWLESIETIVQRQKGMSPERDDHCLLGFTENG